MNKGCSSGTDNVNPQFRGGEPGTFQKLYSKSQKSQPAKQWQGMIGIAVQQQLAEPRFPTSALDLCRW